MPALLAGILACVFLRLGTVLAVGRTLSGTFVWLPSVKIESHVEIEYDDPANFAPLAPPE